MGGQFGVLFYFVRECICVFPAQQRVIICFGQNIWAFLSHPSPKVLNIVENIKVLFLLLNQLTFINQ